MIVRIHAGHRQNDLKIEERWLPENRQYFLTHRYFLRLFFWLAAIFSFAVIGAGFDCATFPSGPAAAVPAGLSSFRLLPLEVSLSLMWDSSHDQNIYPPELLRFPEFSGKFLRDTNRVRVPYVIYAGIRPIVYRDASRYTTGF